MYYVYKSRISVQNNNNIFMLIIILTSMAEFLTNNRVGRQLTVHG